VKAPDIALIRDRATLDTSILEPGDILMVANPTDRPAIRYLVFWSHVGIIGSSGVDVIDAVREPRGEWHGEPNWFHVQRGPLSSYLLSYDILAVRPRLPAAARRAAADYAEGKVGAPYADSLRSILFGRRDTSGYSCASLMWQAYKKQGLNLAPAPSWFEYAVIPLALSRDPQVEVIGRGTRYRLIPVTCRRLRLERRWFRYVLGADILVDGAPDAEG
jgi:uncharacterized protein YycO